MNAATTNKTKCHIWCPVLRWIRADTRVTVPRTVFVAESNRSLIPDKMEVESFTAPWMESDMDLRVSTLFDKSLM